MDSTIWMESEEYFRTIEKVFGFVPDAVEYNILMGSSEDKNENLQIFNNRMKQIQSTHINFITYDDLLEYQVKYLERMKILEIH